VYKINAFRREGNGKTPTQDRRGVSVAEFQLQPRRSDANQTHMHDAIRIELSGQELIGLLQDFQASFLSVDHIERPVYMPLLNE
jgi:hypothetical protein